MKYVQLMIKPASSNCNLKYSYCFYEDRCKNKYLLWNYERAVLETVVKLWKQQKIFVHLVFRW